jgi:DNA polymerase III subunit epsilon
MKYAIVDVETTGGHSQTGKITEIAIVIYQQGVVTERFSSLINPECGIPYFITRLTGISNAMVADAPRFYEVAKQVVEMTEDAIIVGHNVAFDYGFLRHEYLRLGYHYRRQTICTVRLARKVVPGMRHYNLDALCQHFDITNFDRHRALGDAEATCILFEKLMHIDAEAFSQQQQIQNFLQYAHPAITPVVLSSLPQESGVYYFYNDLEELIYIGKSKNIRKRVISHFQSDATKKAVKMKGDIARIETKCTGSEMLACLIESDEIKKHKPIYNKAQRRSMKNYGIYSYQSHDGYLCLYIQRTDVEAQAEPFCSLSSLTEIKKYMEHLVERHHLCKKLCGLFNNQGACFQHGIGLCRGACCGEEKAETYNARVNQAINSITFGNDSFVIYDQGRSKDEFTAIEIVHGKLCGYCYTGSLTPTGELPEIDRRKMLPLSDHHDNTSILRLYLRQHKYIRMVSKHNMG